MREYKFRGMNANGIWVHGNLVYMHGLGNTWTTGIQMLSGEEYRPSGSVNVNPETIGQFTDLKDKNGKMIYEGDIVQEKYGNEYGIGKVVFEDGAFWVKFDDDEYLLIGCDSEQTLVIGNVYENSDLL